MTDETNTLRVRVPAPVVADYQSLGIGFGEDSTFGTAALVIRSIPGKSGTVHLSRLEARAVLLDWQDRAAIYLDDADPTYRGLGRSYRAAADKLAASLTAGVGNALLTARTEQVGNALLTARTEQARYGDALRARDRAMRDARANGASLRRIAEAVNMSPEGVRRIVEGPTRAQERAELIARAKDRTAAAREARQADRDGVIG